jgi:hypothetical protein
MYLHLNKFQRNLAEKQFLWTFLFFLIRTGSLKCPSRLVVILRHVTWYWKGTCVLFTFVLLRNLHPSYLLFDFSPSPTGSF